MITISEKDADFILQVLRVYTKERQFTHGKTCELHDNTNKLLNSMDIKDRDLEEEKELNDEYDIICQEYEKEMNNINKAIEILTIGSVLDQ